MGGEFLFSNIDKRWIKCERIFKIPSETKIDFEKKSRTAFEMNCG